jgi:hypothetical protein
MIAALLAAGIAQADVVVAGWHTWTEATAPVASEGPDEVASGWAGNMGTSILSGGGSRVVASDSGDDTYGNAYSVSGRTVNSTAQLRANNNNIKRMEFLVTNNTGSYQTLSSTQFDYALVYGSAAETTNKLYHLSGASDLDDTPWIGYNIVPPITMTDNAWHDVDSGFGSMTDLTLAIGESAAFRLEIDITGATAAGVNIDNIAVTAIPEPATLGLVSALGGALLAIRRKLMV